LKDLRKEQLIQWLKKDFFFNISELVSMGGDAGFRRYFRFVCNNQSFIAVDSPSDKCNNTAFYLIQQRLEKAGICVPKIHCYESELGFFCLSDLGSYLFSNSVNAENMYESYRRAMEVLPILSSLSCEDLPHYDHAFLTMELSLFEEWLLNCHLSITLTIDEKQKLQKCFNLLIDNAVEQPQVFMHRDFHSRNLMLFNNEIAVIDFQDAVRGPITYDIVSLLKDCYIKWPQKEVNKLLDNFIDNIDERLNVTGIPRPQWQKWFDFMGVQRHIKASGIFARLHHRDGKSAYLADIPLTLSYIVEVCSKYPELVFLSKLVENTVLPELQKRIEAN